MALPNIMRRPIIMVPEIIASAVAGLVAVILGLLIASPLVLYASVGVMGTLEVFIYVLFWAAAAIIAPAIQKP